MSSYLRFAPSSKHPAHSFPELWKRRCISFVCSPCYLNEKHENYARELTTASVDRYFQMGYGRDDFYTGMILYRTAVGAAIAAHVELRGKQNQLQSPLIAKNLPAYQMAGTAELHAKSSFLAFVCTSPYSNKGKMDLNELFLGNMPV